jgi:integrase
MSALGQKQTLKRLSPMSPSEHRKVQLELRFRLGQEKLSDDDLLFPTLEGTLPSPRAFSADWADVAASIGMPEVTFHALRHTHASQLIDAGVDVVTIAKRLGHSGPSITLAVYAHLFRDNDPERPRPSTTR